MGAPVAVGGSGNLELALARFAILTRAMEEIGRRVRQAAPDTVIVATPHNLRLDGGQSAVVTSEFVSGSLTAEAPPPSPPNESGSPAAGSTAGGSPAAGSTAGGSPAAGSTAARTEGAAITATVEASFPCDRELAGDIVARARKAGVPVAGVNYGALSGPNSLVPLDWGALIPLYFIGERSEATPPAAGAEWDSTTRDRGRPPTPRVLVSVGPWKKGGGVVLIGPSRDAPREVLVTLGETVAEAAAASRKRVAFVASCDHGHAHLAGGPYGYDPASVAYDKLVSDIVKADDLGGLLGIDPGLVEAGKPDSLWQMLILLGVLRRQAAASRPMVGEFLAYEAPTYFGMLCASYEARR